ncbi:uncharacterized protein LOC143863520 [Tasmannia lanceolata]|uniref:uncharacterized protein LOC143863520 n=1 Tax=Tasmannia lanceolata TaxID=3420 RepID=UPI004063FBFB
MADSVDAILDFLRQNRFMRAEAALRGELGNRSDLNGSIQKPILDEKDSSSTQEEEKVGGTVIKHQGVGNQSCESSRELIVKEVECRTVANGSESKSTSGSVAERNKLNEFAGASEKSFVFYNGSENTMTDLYPWNFDSSDGPVNPFSKDAGTITGNFSELQLCGQPKSHPVQVSERRNSIGMVNPGKSYGTEPDMSGEERISWRGSTGKAKVEVKHDRNQIMERKELDQAGKPNNVYSKNPLSDNPWSINERPSQSSSEPWKDCSIKTAIPFPTGDASCSYGSILGDRRNEGKWKLDSNNTRSTATGQLDEVGVSKSSLSGKPHGSSEQKFGILDLPLITDNHKEELPWLPPVKLKSEDKSVNIYWEEKVDRHGSGTKIMSADNTFLIGSFLDVPIGQELSPSGEKKTVGNSWLSISQGIAEDASDLVSGFATVGDGLSESVDYPNEYWDSDEYDDDDDVGYMRQPIEDEAWFLAHEIDYPSDNEKGTGRGSIPDQPERGPTKDEDDDQSFAEEDSYFSGEQYFHSKNIEQVAASEDPLALSVPTMYGRTNENDLIAQYDGQLMDEEELNLMRAEPVWKGFVTQTNELIMLSNGRILNECERPRPDDLCIEDDQHGSVRSIGVGINSDAADIGSEVRESLVGGSSEGDLEYFQHDTHKSFIERLNGDKRGTAKRDTNAYIMGPEKGTLGVGYSDGGFSFPPSLRDGDGVEGDSCKTLWSSKSNVVNIEEVDDYGNALIGTVEMPSTWRRRSNDSSPAKSSRDENIANVARSTNLTTTLSNYGYVEREHVEKGLDEKASIAREDDEGTTLEDEEAAAVQEQVRQIRAQEDEFETFNLRIVHRKNRTGFEEDKNFHVVLNSVIAGRYHVTEFLGSAAFSKAIQAHDLHTGMDVCVKIIKNNKDFFDQSLDEIKLLKFVNKNDPADKYHILRLYDYFYYREHLLIVCELLKANLYEFHKFNRESGGEVYFTMPRLQSITIQCLEAVQFLHGLGLIHCDLKPENILVKSYSRCEVKVIDLGSSCFQTDHLCSYVQSRSYRAPEVILGLPYDKKIDIWSLGCILAELCTGNVLFQNDSPATLLARVIGIIGTIGQGMLAKGRDTYKYFSKNHMLYERNQDTNRLEYLIPKKTSLRHRLPMGDQGFIDFVAHLLEINPKKRPTASEALKHPWLSYPYEPISS